MLPLRVLAEGLGKQVHWIEETRTVLISTGNNQLTLTIDVPLPDSMGTPIIINGRTLVPANYVMSRLGATVLWDEENMAVYILQW